MVVLKMVLNIVGLFLIKGENDQGVSYYDSLFFLIKSLIKSIDSFNS